MRTTTTTTRPAKTYWSASEADCMAGVLRAHREEGRIAQTVRHYYYKLLSAGLLRRLPEYPQSGDRAYKYVVALITAMRRSGALPYEAVADPGRRSFTYLVSESLADGLRASATPVFTVDRWRGQARRLEVWVEKDAMADFVHEVVNGFAVPVHVCKGHASVTVVHDAADRYGTGKGLTLLYCGDLDPTRVDIDRFLRDELRSHGCRPDIVRLTLNPDDVTLLPAEAALPLNTNDSRTAYIRRYDPTWRGDCKHYDGDLRGYELDAMPARLLRERLRSTILSYIDAAEWNAAVKVGKATRAAIGAEMRGMFSGLEREWLRNGVPGVDLEDIALDVQRRYLLPPGVAYDDYEPDWGNDEDGGAP